MIPSGGNWSETYPDLYDFVYATNTGFYGRVSVSAYPTPTKQCWWRVGIGGGDGLGLPLSRGMVS